MAIGLGLMLGFHFPENFNRPYWARNIQDFWRRWHISLSSWLRDYLYIGLGGNRFGTWKTYRNLFLIMAIGGLWHGGDSWNYVLWGAAHGIALCIDRAWSRAGLPDLPGAQQEHLAHPAQAAGRHLQGGAFVGAQHLPALLQRLHGEALGAEGGEATGQRALVEQPVAQQGRGSRMQLGGAEPARRMGEDGGGHDDGFGDLGRRRA